jgi:hypothetical protein
MTGEKDQARIRSPKNQDLANGFGTTIQMLKARPFRAEALPTSEGVSLSMLTRRPKGAVLTSGGRRPERATLVLQD